MISPFGVDHGGVSKSYVNGKFVRASKLTAKQAKTVKSGGQWKKAKGPTSSDTAFKHAQTNVMREVRRMKPGEVQRDFTATVKHKGTDKRGNIKVDVDKPYLGQAARASALKLGGKRDGVNIMTRHGSVSRTTEAHERAHLAPKRSGYRMQQIVQNPKKLMREEARADAVADKATGRKNAFKRSAKSVAGDRQLTGYTQAARSRVDSKKATPLGDTKLGRKAKKVPGLKFVVRRQDAGARKAINRTRVKPGLKHMNDNLSTTTPVKRKHLDEYRSVYNSVHKSVFGIEL